MSATKPTQQQDTTRMNKLIRQVKTKMESAERKVYYNNNNDINNDRAIVRYIKAIKMLHILENQKKELQKTMCKSDNQTDDTDKDDEEDEEDDKEIKMEEVDNININDDDEEEEEDQLNETIDEILKKRFKLDKKEDESNHTKNMDHKNQSTKSQNTQNAQYPQHPHKDLFAFVISMLKDSTTQSLIMSIPVVKETISSFKNIIREGLEVVGLSTYKSLVRKAILNFDKAKVMKLCKHFFNWMEHDENNQDQNKKAKQQQSQQQQQQPTAATKEEKKQDIAWIDFFSEKNVEKRKDKEDVEWLDFLRTDNLPVQKKNKTNIPATTSTQEENRMDKKDKPTDTKTWNSLTDEINKKKKELQSFPEMPRGLDVKTQVVDLKLILCVQKQLISLYEERDALNNNGNNNDKQEQQQQQSQSAIFIHVNKGKDQTDTEKKEPENNNVKKDAPTYSTTNEQKKENNNKDTKDIQNNVCQFPQQLCTKDQRQKLNCECQHIQQEKDKKQNTTMQSEKEETEKKDTIGEMKSLQQIINDKFSGQDTLQKMIEGARQQITSGNMTVDEMVALQKIMSLVAPGNGQITLQNMLDELQKKAIHKLETVATTESTITLSSATQTEKTKTTKDNKEDQYLQLLRPLSTSKKSKKTRGGPARKKEDFYCKTCCEETGHKYKGLDNDGCSRCDINDYY